MASLSKWKWMTTLFEEHKLVRRVLVFWAIWLITYVVLEATAKITTIDTATAAMVSAIIGVLATVTGFYLRSRELEDKRESLSDKSSLS